MRRRFRESRVRRPGSLDPAQREAESWEGSWKPLRSPRRAGFDNLIAGYICILAGRRRLTRDSRNRRLTRDSQISNFFFS